jgi:hypothetical protein
MDPRTELSLINKHVRQHNRDVGESIVWFEFVPLASQASAGSLYDDVYDEGNPGTGGRSYDNGTVIPTIYVEEVEDLFTAQEDGRQPVQNLRVTILYLDAVRSGMSDPKEFNKHLKDIMYYDNRYYRVDEYRVRGRLPSEVVIQVRGYEVFLDQDFVFDPGPATPTVHDHPWPSTFPPLSV